MVISKKAENVPVNIIIKGERLEQVGRFKYLGSLITKDARCEQEIRTRISLTKGASYKQVNIVKPAQEIYQSICIWTLDNNQSYAKEN